MAPPRRPTARRVTWPHNTSPPMMIFFHSGERFCKLITEWNDTFTPTIANPHHPLLPLLHGCHRLGQKLAPLFSHLTLVTIEITLGIGWFIESVHLAVRCLYYRGACCAWYCFVCGGRLGDVSVLDLVSVYVPPYPSLAPRPALPFQSPYMTTVTLDHTNLTRSSPTKCEHIKFGFSHLNL